MNNTIEKAFAQIEKLNWVNTDTNELISDEGCSLKIRTEFHPHQKNGTVQVNLSLFKGDLKIWGWGSESTEQNDQIVKWFFHQYHNTVNAKFERDQKTITELKNKMFVAN